MREQVKQICQLVYATVQKHARLLARVSISFLVGVLLLLVVLLIHEYRFFKHQAEKMLVAKEDYQTYVLAVKKILHDYNKTKERLEELETLVVEKKNDFEALDLPSSQAMFPEGVRVYSSDDEMEDEGPPFVVINRELEYLKQGTFEHLKDQKVRYLIRYMNPDSWKEYTDQVIDRNKAEENKKIKARNRRVAVRRRRTRYAAPNKETIKHYTSDVQFIWPIDRSSFWLSSPFGPRKRTRSFHYGLDLAAVKGTPVVSVAPGVVVEARYHAGFGKTVVVAHDSKYRTRYAHLNTILVDVGQHVDRGQRIGKVGATGHVLSKRGGDASHLHFEVHVFGKQVNPMYFLG
jgi:murein DD-endopeptidase MepM/ murein hydrolase activator NlpD